MISKISLSRKRCSIIDPSSHRSSYCELPWASVLDGQKRTLNVLFHVELVVETLLVDVIEVCEIIYRLPRSLATNPLNARSTGEAQLDAMLAATPPFDVLTDPRLFSSPRSESADLRPKV